MTDQQDAVDPRVEPFARFMQARDARTFEVQDTNGDFQTWDGIGEMGREEYLKDAAAYVRALDIIERPVPTTELSADVPENWEQIKQVAVLLAHTADPESAVTVTEFAQAEAAIKYLHPSVPTREQIAEEEERIRRDERMRWAIYLWGMGEDTDGPEGAFEEGADMAYHAVAAWLLANIAHGFEVSDMPWLDPDLIADAKQKARLLPAHPDSEVHEVDRCIAVLALIQKGTDR